MQPRSPQIVPRAYHTARARIPHVVNRCRPVDMVSRWVYARMCVCTHTYGQNRRVNIICPRVCVCVYPLAHPHAPQHTYGKNRRAQVQDRTRDHIAPVTSPDPLHHRIQGIMVVEERARMYPLSGLWVPRIHTGKNRCASVRIAPTYIRAK